MTAAGGLILPIRSGPPRSSFDRIHHPAKRTHHAPAPRLEENPAPRRLSSSPALRHASLGAGREGPDAGRGLRPRRHGLGAAGRSAVGALRLRPRAGPEGPARAARTGARRRGDLGGGARDRGARPGARPAPGGASGDRGAAGREQAGADPHGLAEQRRLRAGVGGHALQHGADRRPVPDRALRRAAVPQGPPRQDRRAGGLRAHRRLQVRRRALHQRGPEPGRRGEHELAARRDVRRARRHDRRVARGRRRQGEGVDQRGAVHRRERARRRSDRRGRAPRGLRRDAPRSLR